ncbi:hypothetical protein F2Q68_00028991 [Brassica cretica]|uniref:Uncharacterized protein n=1 Tax=Brassica cretica TaxID=69181 RepID=A0A8S9G7Z1_BRACR|nr:hypothetical protein F2Q68_00028991 [Brassica cretica]
MISSTLNGLWPEFIKKRKSRTFPELDLDGKRGTRRHMHNLARKCVQSKPVNTSHKLLRLLIGILGENTEVVLAVCFKEFGSW